MEVEWGRGVGRAMESGFAGGTDADESNGFASAIEFHQHLDGAELANVWQIVIIQAGVRERLVHLSSHDG